jgi:O-antigen/teichoic acid export membrane protein
MSKLAFFRQSGWMVVATTASGVLMYAVHKVATIEGLGMSAAEYGVFTTLLQVLNLMSVPAIGLQLTFVQQTASMTSEAHRRELAGAYRALLRGTFLLWLAGLALTFVFQRKLLATYQVGNPVALWVTLLLGLTSLWSPIVLGTLQGKQHFSWLGLASILNGFIRLSAIAVIVLALGWREAAGGMAAAFIGMAAAVAIGAWHTREVWRETPEPFRWAPWLRRTLPLMLGFGATTTMLTVDMLVVQEFFPREETGYYGAAGMIGRALFFFLAPVTAVMFPKIVQSAARAEQSNVLFQAVGVTALLGVGAGLFCTFFAELPLRIVYNPSFLKIAPLVPVFVWCMLPLALASVLVNNLLAREKFAVVPWLAAVAAGYYFALRHAAEIQPQKFEPVVFTLGIFSTLLLLVCLLFTWLAGRQRGT